MIVEVAERFMAPAPRNWETAEVGWFPHHRLEQLDLLTPFRRTLARLGVLPGAED